MNGGGEMPGGRARGERSRGERQCSVPPRAAESESRRSSKQKVYVLAAKPAGYLTRVPKCVLCTRFATTRLALPPCKALKTLAGPGLAFIYSRMKQANKKITRLSIAMSYHECMCHAAAEGYVYHGKQSKK